MAVDMDIFCPVVFADVYMEGPVQLLLAEWRQGKGISQGMVRMIYICQGVRALVQKVSLGR